MATKKKKPSAKKSKPRAKKSSKRPVAQKALPEVAKRARERLLIAELRDCKHDAARKVYPGRDYQVKWCPHCGAFFDGVHWHHPTVQRTLLRDLGAFKHHPR